MADSPAGWSSGVIGCIQALSAARPSSRAWEWGL